MGMDIIVCLKRVPDTGARIKIAEDNLSIVEEGLSWILNPYDEFAVEEAIRIKERAGGRVTFITAGAEGGEEVLRKAIAMGGDEAVYVKDPALAKADRLFVARVLAKVISTIPFDLILCGKQGTDRDYGFVGGAISCLLNIPMVSAIKRLDLDVEKKKAVVHREVEGGVEVVESPLPALFTTQKGLNEPRYPSLPGIMKAKKHKIRYIDLAALGVKTEELLSPVDIEGLSYPSMERRRSILKEGVSDNAKEMVRILKEEVKAL